MTRAVLLAAALSGCSAAYATHAPHRTTPIAAMVVDVAAFSIGSCVGLDAQYRTHNQARLVLGYGTAFGTWLSWWTVP